MKGLPYASIELEAPRLAEPTTGYVIHKHDFEHLSEAFSRMESEPNSEILIVWTKHRFRPGVRLVAWFTPRMLVMLCRKNAFELINDETYEPELSGPERHGAAMPIAEWVPDVQIAPSFWERGRLPSPGLAVATLSPPPRRTRRSASSNQAHETILAVRCRAVARLHAEPQEPAPSSRRAAHYQLLD